VVDDLEEASNEVMLVDEDEVRSSIRGFSIARHLHHGI